MFPTIEGLTPLFALLIAIGSVAAEIAAARERTRAHDDAERKAENAWREIKPE